MIKGWQNESAKLTPSGLAVKNVACPHCGHELVDDGTLAGRTVACSQCAGVLQMPVTKVMVTPSVPQLSNQVPTAKAVGTPSLPEHQGLSFPVQSGRVHRPSRNVGRRISHDLAKNPGTAAVLSFFYVGLGQIYNGQIGKGILMMLAPVPGIILFAMFLIGAFAAAVEPITDIDDILGPTVTISGEEFYVDAIPHSEWEELPNHFKAQIENLRRTHEKQQDAKIRRASRRTTQALGGAAVTAIIMAIVTLGIWVFGMYDAYQVAERKGRRQR